MFCVPVHYVNVVVVVCVNRRLCGQVWIPEEVATQQTAGGGVEA